MVFESQVMSSVVSKLTKGPGVYNFQKTQEFVYDFWIREFVHGLTWEFVYGTRVRFTV